MDLTQRRRTVNASIVVIGLLGQLAFLLGLIWILVHYRSRRAGYRLEERNHLLDRFENEEQFLHFLESDAGRRYLELSGGSKDPRRGLSWAVLIGIFTVFVGLSVFLLLAAGIDPGGTFFQMIATLFVVGGAGILVGAAVAHRMLRSPD
jgi:heme/copper-type cytochrome/quinol oxidase subunit 4